MLNIFAVCLNTAMTSILLCLLAIFKFFIPIQSFRNLISTWSHAVMDVWAWCNHQLIDRTSPVIWDIESDTQLNRDGWYLLIANHLSWTDIVVLYSVFRKQIPTLKFFLKQQLLYVPFLGMACWAVDMPFMKRYSRRYLLKHPQKRGEDRKRTYAACERFRHTPTTIVNFVEGTRFNQQKQQQSHSPYTHLLPPKTGGIACTLAAMGDQFDAVINVTLAYPENTQTPFRDLLSGRMKKIVVRIHVLPMNEKLTGDYFQDKRFKREFNQWLNDVWQEKDIELMHIYASHEVESNLLKPKDSAA